MRPPLVDPNGDALLHVLGVGVDCDAGRPVQSFQALYYGLQLHSIICCAASVTGQYLFRSLEPKQRRPTTWTGIVQTRTINIKFNPLTFTHKKLIGEVWTEVRCPLLLKHSTNLVAGFTISTSDSVLFLLNPSALSGSPWIQRWLCLLDRTSCPLLTPPPLWAHSPTQTVLRTSPLR